jgi:hypothetical protein
MLREDLKAHEIRKRIVAKDCVNTVIIPMALLREGGCVSLKRPFSKVISLRVHTLLIAGQELRVKRGSGHANRLET